MTSEQNVSAPRRPRRRTQVILLGAVPAALATALLVGAPAVGDDAASAPVVAEVTSTPSKPVVVATADALAARADATTAATTVRTSTISYKTFCADPSNPVSTSNTTGKALLTMVNQERAKIGIRPLTWSTSLADAAGSWSRTMLSRDLKTSRLIDGLAHNPDRPGAENVAVVYSSAGYTASTAISKMHKNLVNSSGHCLNLMNPNFKYMGSGVARSSNNRTWYATENFR